MPPLILSIPDMSCAHCTGAVTKALQALPGVSEVRVTLAPKQASLSHDPQAAPLEAILAAVDDAGFEATVVG